MDSSSFRVLSHYFPDRFPSFWERFNVLVGQKRIISAREARWELDHRINKQHLLDWIHANRQIFLTPSPEETEFISEIFLIKHFQQLVSRQNSLNGKPVADPYIIALARSRNGCVVTEEQHKPNAAKIPNVCEHFGISCFNLERMMSQEGWEF
ncbi:MAG: DUF4411 family protein [Chloroflexota bacterium]